MASPAPHPDAGAGRGLTLAGPGEPVPVAFVGRTSTLELQDPVASLRRQVRSCQAVLPAGWFIAAWYWDIESGALDLEARSQGEAYRRFAAAGIPRDGGMADLLAEAATPVPRFAALAPSGRPPFQRLAQVCWRRPATLRRPAGRLASLRGLPCASMVATGYACSSGVT